MHRRRLFRPKGVRKNPILSPWPKGVVFGLSFVLFIVITILAFLMASRSLKPVLTTYAEFQAKQAMSYAFNYALSNVQLKDLATQGDMLKKTPKESHSEFFDIKTNNAGEMTLVNVNTIGMSQFLHDTTQRLEDFLYALDSGQITIDQNAKHIIQMHQKPVARSVSVPLGVVSHNALLGNLGPKVPVRFDFLSSLTTNYRPDVQSVGINSVHVTLYVHAKTTVQLILPFRTKKITVVKDIPIAETTISGEVPKLFSSLKSGSLHTSTKP